MELAWRVRICFIDAIFAIVIIVVIVVVVVVVVVFVVAVTANDWIVTDSLTRQFSNLQQILYYYNYISAVVRKRPDKLTLKSYNLPL